MNDIELIMFVLSWYVVLCLIGLSAYFFAKSLLSSGDDK